MSKVWIVTQHAMEAGGSSKTAVVFVASSKEKAEEFILLTKRYKVVTARTCSPRTPSAKFRIDHYRTHEVPMDTEMAKYEFTGHQIVDDMQQLEAITARWEREHAEWMLSQQPFTPDFTSAAAGSATPPRRAASSSSTSSPTHPFMGVLSRSPPLSGGGAGGGLLTGMVAGISRRQLKYDDMA